MTSRESQGRLKILTHTNACLEALFSWPESNEIIMDDPEVITNFFITFYCINNNKVTANHWSSDYTDLVATEWLKIPANSLVDATVKKYTLQFLANLINIIWLEGLSINIIRKYKGVFKKAAADYESTTVAGFLKIAIIKNATRPELLVFNGTIRKMSVKHLTCRFMLVNRGKASSLDVENFYALSNDNGGTEIKVKFIV